MTEFVFTFIQFESVSDESEDYNLKKTKLPVMQNKERTTNPIDTKFCF